jgi:hypothetical protein
MAAYASRTSTSTDVFPGPRRDCASDGIEEFGSSSYSCGKEPACDSSHDTSEQAEITVSPAFSFEWDSASGWTCRLVTST